MKKMVRCVFLVGVVAVLSVSSAWSAGAIGAFSLKNEAGEKVTQESIKGKKSLFLVVQTACSQCRNELEEVSGRYEDIKAKADVYAVLVDVNSERALAYFKSKGYAMPILLDPDFTFGKAAGVSVTPGTVVVDENLQITFRKTGYQVGQVDKILSEL